MPNTHSAKKKLRQDKKRLKTNLLVKENYKKAISLYKRKPTKQLLKKVFSTLDQAAKKKIIHANKAARLKSRLSKLPTRPSSQTKSPRKKKTIV